MLRQSLAMVVGLMLAVLSLSQDAFSQVESNDPETLLGKAFQAQQQGSFQEAADGYRAFLKQFPDVADVYANLGAAYVQLGRLSEAVTCYQRALELGNGTNPEGTRFNLALAFYKSAQFQAAIEELGDILSGNPQHLNAALVLAD